jgi:fatty-acyl-CoA synthase
MFLGELVIGYGMPGQHGDDDRRFDRAPVSTVGRAPPHVEIKIIDAAGRIVPRGVPGELMSRGYLVMLGYWNDEEKTREAIDAADWIKTGDLATMDDVGYCNIVGRIKDMVIRGGENVYPREIEEFLYRHPKIQDVRVIVVPDRRYGEELCAGSGCAPARLRAPTRSAPLARGESRVTRSRVTSNSSTVFR